MNRGCGPGYGAQLVLGAFVVLVLVAWAWPAFVLVVVVVTLVTAYREAARAWRARKESRR